MNMTTEKAFVRALAVDSYAFSSAGRASHAQAFKAAGASAFIGYLGLMNQARLNYILDQGLAFMPVTLGIKHGIPLTGKFGASFGKTSARQAAALGVLPTTTTFLDLEDATGSEEDVYAFVDEWSKPIVGAGLQAGLYVGAGAVLSSELLYKLPNITAYWQSLSQERDVRGALSEPRCGWQVIQLYPSVKLPGGGLVDWNVIQKDYRGRLPTWMKRL